MIPLDCLRKVFTEAKSHFFRHRLHLYCINNLGSLLGSLLLVVGTLSAIMPFLTTDTTLSHSYRLRDRRGASIFPTTPSHLQFLNEDLLIIVVNVRDQDTLLHLGHVIILHFSRK